ncbi:hypothetical protein SAMN06265355_10257 [Actinomadura mexicana]|uniref:Uncharacterized protein n=2 Tax=Actinomadura mexicana TaxID=134959 RepID=A0A238VMM3_9ACTN|nr:hypothetical protein SAMN06265355_10257 [Actinomadura mexicana]
MECPERAVVLWDLNGATLELAPLGGTPRLDPDVRRELPRLGERYAVNGILTGWAYDQVSEIGLAVPNCHVWGQFASEHWDWQTQTRHEMVPPSSGLSMAHDKLHEVVKDLRLDTECIYVKSHSLVFRFPVETGEKVVEQLVAPLRDVCEAAGDLTLLEDLGLVKLAPARLDKRVALRRILKECVPFTPSVVMNVGDLPDRVIMEELDRMRREGTPTFKVGVRNLRDGVDLFVPGPPRGVLPLIRALGGAPAR